MVDIKGQKGVSIDVDDIMEKFECTICMCNIKAPVIAKCGHSFCKVSSSGI